MNDGLSPTNRLNATRKGSTTEQKTHKPTTKEGRGGGTYLSPAEAPMVVDRAVDTPRHAAEPPKVGKDSKGDGSKDDRLCAF